MEVKMDKLYWGAVVIFAIGWDIEQRMYVDGYTRRKPRKIKGKRQFERKIIIF